MKIEKKKEKKRRRLAKHAYAGKILELAVRGRGVVRLDEASREIGKGKTYAWKLLQWLVEKGKLKKLARGLYLLREK
jgi:predicted transcriptional regulator of viral defense system